MSTTSLPAEEAERREGLGVLVSEELPDVVFSVFVARSTVGELADDVGAEVVVPSTSGLEPGVNVAGEELCTAAADRVSISISAEAVDLVSNTLWADN